MNKPILDATCGCRMMWFNKHNPLAVYVDRRIVPKCTLQDGRVVDVHPDIVADFTALPFADASFMLVVFDPPHFVRAGESSYIAIKYGKLDKDNWQNVIKAGFDECMRVLADYGTLIFKWNETQIRTREIINVIGQIPLFGHVSGKSSNTHWMTFMKLPKGGGQG